jgi:hypothetical protein
MMLHVLHHVAAYVPTAVVSIGTVLAAGTIDATGLAAAITVIGGAIAVALVPIGRSLATIKKELIAASEGTASAALAEMKRQHEECERGKFELKADFDRLRLDMSETKGEFLGFMKDVLVMKGYLERSDAGREPGRPSG